MHLYVLLVSKAADPHMHLVTVASLDGVCMPYSLYEINFRLLKAQG